MERASIWPIYEIQMRRIKIKKCTLAFTTCFFFFVCSRVKIIENFIANRYDILFNAFRIVNRVEGSILKMLLKNFIKRNNVKS